MKSLIKQLLRENLLLEGEILNEGTSKVKITKTFKTIEDLLNYI